MPDLWDNLKAAKLKLVTAESCTGGLLATHITSRPGASKIFDRGYVTYCNNAKIDCLGVPEETLSAHGAVSEETAKAMAKGALQNSQADIALATTGIAGPEGGSAEKPVGLVYSAYAYQNRIDVVEHRFSGGRREIQQETVDAVLEYLNQLIKQITS